MDNDKTAPVIPAGTEPNMYGSTMAFQAKDEGQAEVTSPNNPEGEAKPELPQPATETPARSSFEELATKKGFKSPDDMANAYSNLEKDNTQKSMDLSDLQKAKEEGIPEATPVYDEINQDEAVKIVQTMIDKQVSPIKEKLAIAETFKNKDDMVYAPQVAELVKKNPGIPWDVALDAVKARSIPQATQQATEKAQEETYATIQQKQAAQTDNVRVGSKETYDTSQLNDIIADKNIPFSEVQKIMKEKYSQ